MRFFPLLLVSLAVPAFAAPGPRQAHQMMTFDEAAGRVLLFGGTGPKGILGGLWSWDGRAWTLLAEGGPPARESGAMAWDARRRRTVLFGGRGPGGTPLGDTWEWDGSRWRKAADEGAPPRVHSTMAFDHKRGTMILFGPRLGATSMPRPLPSETWTWDGTRWTQIPQSAGPADCLPVGMAYDTRRKAVLLVATTLAPAGSGSPWGGTDLWEWTGAAWRKTNGAPPPLLEPATANIAAGLRGGLLVFGGGTTSLWDGRTWRALTTEGPAGRSGHVMARDARRKRIVLFGGTRLLPGGGRERLGDTWEWDGSAWASMPYDSR